MHIMAMCYHGIHECTRNDGTDKETTREGPGLQKDQEES